MKLLGISLGAILVSVIVWCTLWMWGQGLTYKPYDHPLLSWESKAGKPALALSTNSLQEAKDFLQKDSDRILVLNLRISADGHFFTASPGALDFVFKLSELEPALYKGNKHFYYQYTDLKRFSPDLISIEDWIQLKPRFWIFNILDNSLDIDKHLTLWTEKNELQNKIVITSDADIVISSMKDLHPLWIYGTSLSDLTKLLTMASVNLETLVNFKRDYFITPISIKNREVLNPKVILEMKRRFKKVAIGPVHTDQDLEKALKLQPDVLILDSATADKETF